MQAPKQGIITLSYLLVKIKSSFLIKLVNRLRLFYSVGILCKRKNTQIPNFLTKNYLQLKPWHGLVMLK